MFAHVVGTRPNFIKSFSIIKEMKIKNIQHMLIHTGQHYDYEMSQIFFDGLDLPKPDIDLGVKSSSHAKQTADVMVKCEDVFLNYKPDCVIVYGDVNSTLGAALAAQKIHIPIVHIESGCRSFDKSEPEEINRVLVDHLSDFHFCTENAAVNNLSKENIDRNVFLVGNVMIDALHGVLETTSIENKTDDFALLTLHRVSNVANIDRYINILDVINSLGTKFIYPVHPRMLESIKQNDFINRFTNIEFTDPMGYREFIKMLCSCSFTITDSGGVQCEASVVNKPCITLRKTTEHLSTITELGTNSICSDFNKLPELIKSMPEYPIRKRCELPFIWDGFAGKRVVDYLLKFEYA